MSFSIQKTWTILLLLVMATFHLNAQNKNTSDTLTVSGNCSMCKKRIEEAAYVKGVKLAEWNKSTRVLNVVYSTKTNKQAIINAVLSAGHDASGQKANDQQYAKLPSCCAYRTGTCDH